MNRRRRRYSGQKKPISVPSVVTAVMGAVSILAFAVIITLATAAGGNSTNVVGGISVLLFLASAVAVVYGWKIHRNDNFELISRWLGVIVPAVATLNWLVLYMIGILVG